jgi:hypothetical protein
MRPDNDLGLRVFGVCLQIGPKRLMNRRIVLRASENERRGACNPKLEQRGACRRAMF